MADPAVLEYYKALKEKALTYDPTNPLGLDPDQETSFRYGVPILVTFTLLCSACTCWFLNCRYIVDLVTTPGLIQLSSLSALLSLCGPAYVWMVQEGYTHVAASQTRQCFLLQWVHNFSLLAMGWTLVILLQERAFTVDTLDMDWSSIQRRMRHLCTGVLVLSVAASVLGLVLPNDYTPQSYTRVYPVCNPWWNNEYSHNSFHWHWLFVLEFSVFPSVCVLISIILLLYTVYRWNRDVHSRADNMEHFSGLLHELEMSSNTKFCQTCLCLAVVFLVTFLPLGIYSLVAPGVLSESGRLAEVNDLTTATPEVNNTTSVTMETSKVNSVTPAVSTPGYYVTHSYLLNVSRTPSESGVWMLAYCFGALITPVLLATEILFRREASERVAMLRRMFQRMFQRIVKRPTPETEEDHPMVKAPSTGVDPSPGVEAQSAGRTIRQSDSNIPVNQTT